MFIFRIAINIKNKLIGVTLLLFCYNRNLFWLNYWSRIIFIPPFVQFFNSEFFFSKLGFTKNLSRRVKVSFTTKFYSILLKKKNFINERIMHCIIDRTRCKIWWMEKFFGSFFVVACNLLSEWTSAIQWWFTNSSQ